ncbi:uncharacterized protein LOC117342510 [Pecten maximus]|uniref:uncharacterized protein LOC117342510 n=1 Tax=Pecten maximus TaxID=6579 RepID=UPI001458BDD5|nr:uncharacterized protein LOC117342510 [Pecten maximus]
MLKCLFVVAISSKKMMLKIGVASCLSLAVLTIFNSHVTAQPDPDMCECECDYHDKLQKWKERAEEEKRLNVTAEEKREEAEIELKNTKRQLAVNTSTLSSNTRKYVSAEDNRTTAVSLGFMGAVLIAFMVAGIVACDLISIKQHVYAARTGDFAHAKKQR